jgi:hypothetical protein
MVTAGLGANVQDGGGSTTFTPHTIEEHLAALASAGFGIAAIREPRLKIRGADTPVVAIFHAVKKREAAR